MTFVFYNRVSKLKRKYMNKCLLFSFPFILSFIPRSYGINVEHDENVADKSTDSERYVILRGAKSRLSQSVLVIMRLVLVASFNKY